MNNTLTRYSGSSSALSSYSDSYGLSEYGGNFTQALAITNLHEQGRALLTSTALESIGALSAMEGYLCQMAPSGAHRYKALIDVCTKRMAETIYDW
jgi:hypothetical protein